MQTLKFNITTFEDLKIDGLTEIFNGLFNFMKIELDKGNTLVIVRPGTNGQTDSSEVIKTIEELQHFEQTLE